MDERVMNAEHAELAEIIREINVLCGLCVLCVDCVNAAVRRTMGKRLLKGGHVVDPVNGRDGVFDLLIEDGRIARVGRDLPRDSADEVVDDPAGPPRLPGTDRHARPPAGAGAGAQGDGGDRHGGGGGRRLHRGRVHAEHDAGERQRRRHRLHPAESRRGEPRARLSDRRRLARPAGRAARRHRRAQAGGLRRGDRRRAAGGDGAADAARARVHEHVRHAGDRALRGADAQGRRRRPRRVPGVDARPARHPGRGRVDHGAARHLARRADRRRRPHRAHERAADARRGPLRQGSRDEGHLRGHPAPLRPDRRDARRTGAVRHQRQDEPAAARDRRPRRDAARALPTAAST